MTDDIVKRARDYLAANAAESGADVLIADLIDELVRRDSEIDRMHMTVQAARGEERETCARMAREYARAMSKGTHTRAGSVEEIGERIAAYIEIPF